MKHGRFDEEFQHFVKKDNAKTKRSPEVIKAMTPEELEAFKRARFEKFIKPFIDRNLVSEPKKK